MAKHLLNEGGFTFAAVGSDRTITFTQRGIKPLLGMTDCKTDLRGFSAADKVIGKAAALLYVLLMPEEIYTRVISRPALEVLDNNNISIKYDILTQAVRNRDNTGFCPMETAVRNTDVPEEALELIRRQLIMMSEK